VIGQQHRKYPAVILGFPALVGALVVSQTAGCAWMCPVMLAAGVLAFFTGMEWQYQSTGRLSFCLAFLLL